MVPVLALALGLVCGGVTAEEQALTYDRISLSASAQTEVANDRMSAVLYLQREGQDAVPLAAEVNQAIEWAVAEAKRVTGVDVHTLDYRTQPVYGKQILTGWRVRQSIRLTSADSGVLSALIGRLQQRLAVADIAYELSSDRRQQVENGLVEEAIGRFSERARLVAGALGRSDYRLVSLDVSTGGPAPRPVFRGAVMAMAEAAPAPALEPGTETVLVQVSGTIELQVR